MFALAPPGEDSEFLLAFGLYDVKYVTTSGGLSRTSWNLPLKESETIGYRPGHLCRIDRSLRFQDQSALNINLSIRMDRYGEPPDAAVREMRRQCAEEWQL